MVSELYPYLVALHVTAVVFLVGGMLAHERMSSAIARHSQDRQADSLTALRKLDQQVTTPALLLTWVLGLTLALWMGWLPTHWLQLKLFVVVLLSALHGIQAGRLRRSLAQGKLHSAIPGVGIAILAAMITIATLAIVKPF